MRQENSCFLKNTKTKIALLQEVACFASLLVGNKSNNPVKELLSELYELPKAKYRKARDVAAVKQELKDNVTFILAIFARSKTYTANF